MTAFRPLPTLKQLRHLLAVAEHEHFGRAAQACYIAQSSLSASIKELETLLGQVLIERTKRSVMLTPLGQELVERAGKIVADLEDLVDLAAARAAPLHGSLRLGVIPTISPFLLPRLLPGLRRDHPALKLYIREDQSAHLVEALEAGRLDLILLAFPYPTEGLETLVFAEDGFFVALPKTDPRAAQKALTSNDIRAEELLLLEDGHCLRDHALGACHLPHKARLGEFQATSLTTLVQMVDNGLGVTLLPCMAVKAGIAQSTDVALLPLEGEGASRGIGFAWRRASPRWEDFQLLAERFRSEI